MKKFFKIILVTLVLVTGMMSVFAADDSNTDVLHGIGVIPERINPIGEMTRYEFAKIVANLLAFDTHDYSKDEVRYSDVDAKSEYAASVNKVSLYGVMLGTSEHEFSGNENITFEQATVILVRALGYGYMAEQYGGYPGGYIKTASGIGLLKSIPDASTAERICAMVYNAMTVPIAEQVYYNNDDVSIYKSKDDTVLSSYFGYHIETGRLLSVGKAAISSGYSVSEGDAMVDSNIYDVSDMDDRKLRGMLGRKIEMYCDDDGNIIYCRPLDTGKDLHIDFENIQDIENGSIKYSDGSRMRTVSVDKAAYIVYNDRPLSSMPQIGRNSSITLVNHNGIYDLVLIKDYATKIVNRVYDDSILFNDGTALTETDDDKKYVFVTSNNKVADASAVQDGNTLSIAASIDGDFAEVIISTMIDNGKILSVSGVDYNDFSVNISGIDYGVTPEFYDSIIDSYDLIGFSGQFYVDKDGRIAHRKAENDSYIMTIGYMLDVNEGGFFDPPSAYILTTDGVRKEYEFKLYKGDTVRIDNQSVKFADFAANNTDSDGKFIPQVIAFKTNSDGKVTNLETAADERTDSLYKFAENVTGIFRSNINSFGSKVLLSPSAKVFLVPSNSDSLNDYTAGDLSVFKTSRSYKGLDFYSYSNDNLYANIVVSHYNTLGTDKTADAPIIIDQMLRSYVNEDEVDSIEGYGVSGYTQVYASPQYSSIREILYAADLNRTRLSTPVYAGFGDIVRCSRTVENDVSMLGIFYDYSEDECLCVNPMSETDNKMKLSLGTAIEIDRNSILKLKLRGSDETEYYNLSKVKVVVCEGDKLHEGALGDIAAGTDGNTPVIIVYSTYDTAQCVYVYYR